MNRVQRLFHLHNSLLCGQKPRDAHSWGRLLGVNARTVMRDIAFLKYDLGAPLFYDPRLGGYRYDQPKRVFMPDGKDSKWTRLLILIHRICAEPGKSAKQLADDTGCVERTIYRDIQELEKAGLPIYNDNGYRFAADAFLPNFNLSPSELFSLFVAVRLLESHDGDALGREARSALEKFLRTSPDAKRPDLNNLRNTIQVKGAEEETGASLLASMQDALCSGRQLAIHYRGMKDEDVKERLLDPLGLFCFRQVWYLHAYDHGRSALRNFRLSRISQARTTDERVKHEPNLELEQASYHKWDVEGRDKVLVRIRVTPSLARWLQENPAHPSQVLLNDQVHYQVSDPVAMARWVASLYGLEVVEPDALRQEMARIATDLQELYRQGCSDKE